VTLSYDSQPYVLKRQPREIDRHFRRIVRFLGPRPGDRLLEVGCGRGFLTRRVRELCPATVGVDLAPQAIAHAVVEGLQVMDATALEFDDARFDKVYSFHAIEHIPQADRALAEIRRVLVPGGRALLVYPAEPIRGLYAIPGAWQGYGNPFKARELHVHKFTPRKLRELAARCGLAHVESALHFLLVPQFLTVLERPRVDGTARS
jgi:ubiquinone/menaquinone biosynthesis C-methylase UbiE